MKHIKNVFITTLIYTLGCSVILASSHAKDVAAQSAQLKSVSTVVNIQSHDLVNKAISDLHNHIDKTALKTFVKTIGDQTILSNGRQNRLAQARDTRTLSTMLMEALLLVRMAYAIAR